MATTNMKPLKDAVELLKREAAGRQELANLFIDPFSHNRIAAVTDRLSRWIDEEERQSSVALLDEGTLASIGVQTGVGGPTIYDEIAAIWNAMGTPHLSAEVRENCQQRLARIRSGCQRLSIMAGERHHSPGSVTMSVADAFQGEDAIAALRGLGFVNKGGRGWRVSLDYSKRAQYSKANSLVMTLAGEVLAVDVFAEQAITMTRDTFGETNTLTIEVDEAEAVPEPAVDNTERELVGNWTHGFREGDTIECPVDGEKGKVTWARSDLGSIGFRAFGGWNSYLDPKCCNMIQRADDK